MQVLKKEHQTFVARQLHEIEALQAAYPHVNKILVCCCVISECRVSHMCKLVVCELADAYACLQWGLRSVFWSVGVCVLVWWCLSARARRALLELECRADCFMRLKYL